MKGNGGPQRNTVCYSLFTACAELWEVRVRRLYQSHCRPVLAFAVAFSTQAFYITGLDGLLVNHERNLLRSSDSRWLKRCCMNCVRTISANMTKWAYNVSTSRSVEFRYFLSRDASVLSFQRTWRVCRTFRQDEFRSLTLCWVGLQWITTRVGDRWAEVGVRERERKREAGS